MSQLDFVEIIPRKHIFDSRGSFLKLIVGNKNGLNEYLGEAHVVIGYPGQSRANHYHKKATEWFTLISGVATLQLVEVETGNRRDIPLDASKPVTVRVPSLVAHAFSNHGKSDFMLFAYSNCRYDSNDITPFNIA